MARHVHKPLGRDDYLRPDGIREVWWKCICGLEEKRRFDGEEVVGVAYRFGGVWVEAAEFLMLKLPLKLCPTCKGFPDDWSGCDGCGGVGVVEPSGDRLSAPAERREPRRVP